MNTKINLANKNNRIARISKACSDEYLHKLSILLKERYTLEEFEDDDQIIEESHPEPELRRLEADILYNVSLRADAIHLQNSKTVPTLNQLTDLSSECGILLLFSLENVAESVKILVDPKQLTVSQLVREIKEWLPVMEPIAKAGQVGENGEDDGDTDSEESEEDDDENPVPGHEDDDNAPDPDRDGEDREGGEGEDEDEEDDESDEDDDDDEDDDEEDDDRHDHDDDAWRLHRLIRAVDQSGLRLRISPQERSSNAGVEDKQIWIETTLPERTRSQLLKSYTWWPALCK